ncbi:hypothetical protein VTN02DRAFT_4517 [Thermoascus thermophilus]
MALLLGRASVRLQFLLTWSHRAHTAGDHRHSTGYLFSLDACRMSLRDRYTARNIPSYYYCCYYYDGHDSIRVSTQEQRSSKGRSGGQMVGLAETR